MFIRSSLFASSCTCFFSDPATPSISSLPYTTLFRSPERSPTRRLLSMHEIDCIRFAKGQISREDLSRECQCSANTLRSEEHTSELQSRFDLVCRLLLEKTKSVIASTETIPTK